MVQLLLEKGKPNVDLATKVFLILMIYFDLMRMKKGLSTHVPKQKNNELFVHFFPLLFYVLKVYGQTALDTAAFNGHEQIVQILLEKGKAKCQLPNVNCKRKVIFSFFFYF